MTNTKKKFILVPGNNGGVVKKALLDRGNWEEIEDSDDYQKADFVWKPNNLPIRSWAKIDASTKDLSSLVINHFESNRNLCTKTGLIRSLKQYYLTNEHAANARYSTWETIPTTFLITSGVEDSELLNFKTRFDEIAKGNFSREHLAEKHCKDNLWLIKPANLNQGRGIQIFRSLDKAMSFLNSQPADSYWVAQKYLERPLLYKERKFDIRIWALVTHRNEVFFYKHGYMRTASDSYSLDNPNNYVHLTNNCLQKHGENYGKHEPGNTLSLNALQEYLDQNHGEFGVSVEKHIVPRMRDLIIDSFLSAKKSLNPNKRKNCFELFGYDFIIDEDFRTWLLEVNTNPYFGYANDFARDLVTKMVNDMLEIALDPVHPPPAGAQVSSDNGFELIYCELGSPYHHGPLNRRGPFYDNIYPVPSLAPKQNPHKKFGVQERLFRGLPVDSKYRRASLSADRDGSTNETFSTMMTSNTSTLISKKITTTTQSNSSNPTTPNGMKMPSPRSQMTFSTLATEKNGERDPQPNSAALAIIDNIYNSVKKMLSAYSTSDYEEFLKPVSRILSMMTNWELLSDNEIKTACKAFTLIAEAKINGVLAEPENVTTMIGLLNSQNIPLDIQLAIVLGIVNLVKQHGHKKRLACNQIIHSLSKIAINACDEEKEKDYDTQVLKHVITCLCYLAGMYNRRNYIPVETRENDKLRAFFINMGGLITLKAISKIACNEELRKIPKDICFPNLDLKDWELQLLTINKIIRDNVPLSSNNLDAQPVKEKVFRSLRFLFHNGPISPQNSKIVGKFVVTKEQPPLVKETDDIYTCNSDQNIQIPEALLKIKSYPLEKIKEDVETRIKNIQEWLQKCERDEAFKKEQEQLEKANAEQRRQQEMNEKRKKLEQDMALKRLEEKRKQEENAKRNSEMKIRLVEEDEKRRARINEILRKKSEGRGTQPDYQLKKKEESNLNARASIPYMRTIADFQSGLNQIQESSIEFTQTAHEFSLMDLKNSGVKVFEQRSIERIVETPTAKGDGNNEVNFLTKSSSIVQLPVIRNKYEREGLTDDNQKILLSRTFKNEPPTKTTSSSMIQKPIIRSFKVANKTMVNGEGSNTQDKNIINLKKDGEAMNQIPQSRLSHQRHHTATQSGSPMKHTYYDGRTRLKHYTTSVLKS